MAHYADRISTLKGFLRRKLQLYKKIISCEKINFRRLTFLKNILLSTNGVNFYSHYIRLENEYQAHMKLSPEFLDLSFI